MPLACHDGKKIRAHLLILAPVSCEPIHATPQCNVPELKLLCDTFTCVCSAGGQANLSLQTKDSHMWAKLDLQLGPFDEHRPWPPVAGAASQPQPGAEDSARARAAKSEKSPDCWGSKLYRSWGNYKWNHWRQHWQNSTAGWPSWDISNITIAGWKQSQRR